MRRDVEGIATAVAEGEHVGYEEGVALVDGEEWNEGEVTFAAKSVEGKGEIEGES